MKDESEPDDGVPGRDENAQGWVKSPGLAPGGGQPGATQPADGGSEDARVWPFPTRDKPQ